MEPQPYSEVGHSPSNNARMVGDTTIFPFLNTTTIRVNRLYLRGLEVCVEAKLLNDLRLLGVDGFPAVILCL